MLGKRIFSSAVLILSIAAAMYVNWVCALFITAFIVAGLYEFYRMLENKGINVYKYFGIIMGAIIPLSILVRFELTKGWEFLFVVSAFIFLILMQFKRRKSSGTIVDISTTIFGIFYISWFLSFAVKIRYFPNPAFWDRGYDYGLGLLTSLLLVAKLGDIGAYAVGARFGRTPLIPRISPNKSVEGAIGGLVFSILGALLSKPFLSFPYSHLVLLGFAGGVLAQLGDLSESLMKRDCQVKDSGNIFPGMGGVLDLVDSLIFTAPAFYFYMYITVNAFN